jgi:hypothetical protein
MARLSRSRAKSSSNSLGAWGSSAAFTLLLMLLQGGVIMIPRSAEAATETDSYSTKELDSNFIEIHRKKHRFRHWKWSGICPFFGGWIPDPHILATPVREFSKVIREAIGCNGTARYQGLDINSPKYLPDENVTDKEFSAGIRARRRVVRRQAQSPP